MSCGASTGGMSVLMRIFSKKYQMKIRSDLVVAHLGSQESESSLFFDSDGNMRDLETKRDELNFANHRHAKSGPRQKSERTSVQLQ